MLVRSSAISPVRAGCSEKEDAFATGPGLRHPNLRDLVRGDREDIAFEHHEAAVESGLEHADALHWREKPGAAGVEQQRLGDGNRRLAAELDAVVRAAADSRF